MLKESEIFLEKKIIDNGMGHTDNIYSIKWSHTNGLIASASADKTVRVWDPNSGKEIKRLMGHRSRVYDATWSPDGSKIASSSSSGEVIIWDMLKGGNGKVFKWETERIRAISWSPNGKYIALGYSNGVIRVISGNDHKEILKLNAHDGIIWSLDWSRDSRLLASGGSDDSVAIIDIDKGEIHKRFEDELEYVFSITWAHDDKHFATGSGDRLVRIWNLKKGVTKTLKGHEGDILAVEWNPRGNVIASGAADKKIHIWHLNDGDNVQVLNGHKKAVLSLSWQKYGNFLASSSSDRDIIIWNILGNKVVSVFDRNSYIIRDMSFDALGRNFAVADNFGYIKIFQLKLQNGEYSLVIKSRVTNSDIKALDWGMNGKIAIGTKDKNLMVINPETGERLEQIRTHDKEIKKVKWDPSGELLATGSLDKSVIIWDAEKLEALSKIENFGYVYAIDWSKDGKYLAVGDGKNTVSIINVKNYDILDKYSGHYGDVLDLAWHPRENLLASASSDGKILFWDLDENELVDLIKHDGYIRSIAFSEDGEFLTSGTDDGFLLVKRMHGNGVEKLFIGSSLNKLICGQGRLLIGSGIGEIIQLKF